MSYINAPKRSRRFAEHIVVPTEQPEHCARCGAETKELSRRDFGTHTFWFCESCLDAPPVTPEERKAAEDRELFKARKAATERAHAEANPYRRVTVVLRGTNSRKKIYLAVHELVHTGNADRPLETRCGFEVYKDYDDVATRKTITCEDCDKIYTQEMIADWLEKGATIEQIRAAFAEAKRWLAERNVTDKSA